MNLLFRAFRLARWAATLLLIAGLAGCDRDDVKVYHVVKDDSSTTPPPPTPAATASAPADSSMSAPASADNAQPSLQFNLPPGWQQIPPSQMRIASFSVTNAAGPAADVGVIPLPSGEDTLALVNMWRDQMQLPALTNAPTAETVSVGDAPATFFEIASDQPLIDNKFRARVLVAELTRGQTSWFFKMTGEDSFVASQKDAFLQFLKTISFVDNTTSTGGAADNIAGVPAAESQPANSIWTVPAGWQSLPPSEFLAAKFSIQSGNAKAEVNVAELAGEGGGLLSNVNRWRGQLGLPPVTDADLAGLATTIKTDAGTFQVVDFTGVDSKTGKPTRLVGAAVPANGQTWFYKLMGDGSVVDAQKDTFVQFIESAKYP